MTAESQDFDVAPSSGMGWVSFPELWALFISVLVADALMAMKSHSHAIHFGDYMAPVYVGLVGAMLTSWKNRLRRFRIDGQKLMLGKESYELDDLREATRDRGAMEGARRLRCAHPLRAPRALGSKVPRYKSPRLGEFSAYVTDRERTVVLRWPERVLALSPADPEFFVLMVRKAARLSR
ncbi:MAG TPA: hypothetical protein VGG34_11445 [Opitutaceae bacterium]|jgi:hypothetical protein